MPLNTRPSTALVKKGDGNGVSQRRGGPGVSLLRNLTLHTGASLATDDKDELKEEKGRSASFVIPEGTAANQLVNPIPHQPISL